MRWAQGRADIERMLADGELGRAAASREHAERLLGQARRHLEAAELTCELDPEGSYGMLYDASRKAFWATLANQGLRPTTRGGHLAVYHAVMAQLDPPLGAQLRPFDRMRRRRHEVEYPEVDTPELVPQDVRDDVPKVRVILDIATRVLDSMGVF